MKEVFVQDPINVWNEAKKYLNPKEDVKDFVQDQKTFTNKKPDNCPCCGSKKCPQKDFYTVFAHKMMDLVCESQTLVKDGKRFYREILSKDGLQYKDHLIDDSVKSQPFIEFENWR